MVEERIKLPRSSYSELCKIIVAYGRVNKPSSLEEITHRTGISPTKVSANNAFLTAIGLIEGGKAKFATAKGTQLAQALEHEIPDEIARAWRIVVEESDFLSKMALAVQIRKGMDESQFEAHIAYSAGEAKSREVMTGAKAVIDILRASAVVKEEGDQILPLIESLPSSTAESFQKQRNTEQIAKSVEQLPVVTQMPAVTISRPAGLSLHIEVRIEVKPDDLEGLGEKLRSLIEAVSSSSVDQSESSVSRNQEG
jgi:hypothetical protein